MLTGIRLLSLTLRSGLSRTSRSVVTAASRKIQYMGFKPELVTASLENQYYRRYLEAKQPAIPVPISDLPAAVQKLQAVFESEGSLEDPQHDELVKELAEKLPLMKHDMVIHVLNLLAYGPKHVTRFNNRNTLWSAIDSVLVREHKRTERSAENLHLALDCAMLMCMANPGRIPNFAFNLSSSCAKRLKSMDLGKDRLLKLLFILNLARNPLPHGVARDLEHKVLMSIDDMTFEEVGMVASAFFKTQTAISSADILCKIVQKAMIKENRTSDDLIALSSILKILKYQIVPDTVGNVRDLIDSFTKEELMRMSPMGINHLCRLSAAYHKYSPLILSSSVEMLSTSIQAGGSRVRFKDVVETLRSCDDFGYSPDPLLMNQIIAGWPLPEEIFEYPNAFITYLSLLASLGYYPETLIERCFSYKFLSHAKERCQPFPYIALLALHTILSIDCYPKFNGNLLRPEEIDDAVRRIGRADIGLVMDKRSRPNTFTPTHMKSLFWKCKEKFGERIVYAYILPYVKFPEIILLGEGQDAEWLKTRKLVPGAFAGSSCISVGTRQQYADSESKVQRNFYTRKKQLQEKLGLRTVTIHFADLSTLTDDLLDQYLSKAVK